MNYCIIKDPLAVNVAAALIATGARTPLVEALTGLSGSAIKKIAHGLGITLSGRGPLPDGVSSFTTRKLRASASLFADCFDTFRKNREAIDAGDLIRCHSTYLSILPDALPGIDINHAWIVARDLHARIVTLQDCKSCGGRYFWGDDDVHQMGCPICSLFDRAIPKGDEEIRRSFITKAQWNKIMPLFGEGSSAKKKMGRPPTSHRDVIEALGCAVATGCSLRALPKGYPSYKTCRRRIADWDKAGILGRILEILGGGMDPDAIVSRILPGNDALEERSAA